MYTTEDINKFAMEMIMFAGDARTTMNDAFLSLKAQKFDQAKELMNKAHSEIIEGHKKQTIVIQKTIDDETFQTTLLFTHAQDTLMTVYSEYNTLRKMAELFELVIKEGGN